MVCRQVTGGVGARARTAHRLDEVLTHQIGRLGEQAGKLLQVEDLRRDDALLRTVVAQVAHQRARVDALERHDAALGEVGGHALDAAPVGRRAAHVVHDHAAQSRARGERRVAVGAKTGLRIDRVDAVVADLRVGHGHNLAGVARVGEDLEVPLERRVEAHLARRRARGAARAAVKDRAVGEHQQARSTRLFAGLRKHVLREVTQRCAADGAVSAVGTGEDTRRVCHRHRHSFPASRDRLKGG